MEFGNVALIPQPTTDVVKGDPYSKQGDDFDAVHGTGKAPPHFYVAAYLWAREKFGADAIVHFGTHGSLEFAKGKTAFPTESCFPDALIGNKPSGYIYSINNVGEALLAKRRIRSVLISHLTPPFMRGGLDGAARELDDKIHEYETCDEPLLKSELGVSLAELAISSGVVDDLLENPAFQQFADPARKSEFLRNKETFSEERLDALHALLHRYENARATNGLHVLGRPWTDEQVAETSDLSELLNDEAAERLRASFQLELDRFFAALSGRFVPPSPGGDFLHTPDAAPTGRNLTGLDVQRLPTPEAERVGAKLVDELLQTYRDRNDGAWPRKVANTLWGGESIRTQGVGIAQVLYLMGVRVKRDGRGAASDVELIPSSELGRPRIDVLVQTSGQFRDSFGSRIELVDRAVALAAEAPEAEPFPNFVRENARKIEERLVAESRLAEPEARDLATARVFGATNALSYGTGIMNLVERGDAWEKDEDVANRYLANMSGVYRDANRWGAPFEGLLEYNLDGLDLSTQTRSSNSWGPAKLDHVYEFATLATAARVKTGRAPEIWFHDLRDASKPRVESARAALREELRSTLWNSKYLSGLQREGASAAASVSETTRNLFGWSVARPDLIDDSIWEETKAVLVDDVKGLGIREWFEDKNPGALQDATAVMLLAIRKGRWSASEETKAQIARLHAELVQKFGASGSYETSGDSEARKFIADLLEPDLKSAYQEAIDFATTPPPTPVDGLSLTEATDEPERDAAPSLEEKRFPVLGLALALIAILCFLSGFLKSKKNSRGA